MSTNTSEFWRFGLISIKRVYLIALKSYNFGGFGILLMSDVFAGFRQNFTGGFGYSKRVDQELQQLIYLTTFRLVTVLCFAYNQV
jgi:hypothetical protein